MDSMPQVAPGQSRKRNVFDILESLPSGDAKNLMVRVDFNVPMNAEFEITDDSRIRGALPTIQAILKAKHNAILMSHMGRPKLVQKGEDSDGSQRKALTLSHVQKRLSELISVEAQFVDDCVGAKVKDAVAKLPKEGGAILLLENLRFYKGEEKNDPEFVRSLASVADAYVNDAFGTSHRAHASVAGVPSLLPKEKCGVGCLVAKEVAFLDFSSLGEDETVAAVIGGSKVSTKLPVIKGLLNQVQILVLGGGLAYTFAKAQGISIGTSLCEEDMVETAKGIIAEAEAKGKKLVLPIDSVCSKEFPKGEMKMEDTKTFELAPGGGIEDGWMGLDVGPKTAALFNDALSAATKVVFNGPMGVFEIRPFDEGTKALVDTLEAVTKKGAVSVVGGGDSVAALEQFNKTDVVTYVSTGGGATLELLAGDELPGVVAISNLE